MIFPSLIFFSVNSFYFHVIFFLFFFFPTFFFFGVLGRARLRPGPPQSLGGVGPSARPWADPLASHWPGRSWSWKWGRRWGGWAIAWCRVGTRFCRSPSSTRLQAPNSRLDISPFAITVGGPMLFLPGNKRTGKEKILILCVCDPLKS